jgi:PAS domain S-box-containing protein
MGIEEELSTALLAGRSDAIIAADAQGVIRFWNPGAQRIFGYTAAETIGQSLDLIIPEGLRKRHWDGYGEVMRTGKSRYGEGDVLASARTASGFRSSSQFCRCADQAAPSTAWARCSAT